MCGDDVCVGGMSGCEVMGLLLGCYGICGVCMLNNLGWWRMVGGSGKCGRSYAVG